MQNYSILSFREAITKCFHSVFWRPKIAWLFRPTLKYVSSKYNISAWFYLYSVILYCSCLLPLYLVSKIVVYTHLRATDHTNLKLEFVMNFTPLFCAGILHPSITKFFSHNGTGNFLLADAKWRSSYCPLWQLLIVITYEHCRGLLFLKVAGTF